MLLAAALALRGIGRAGDLPQQAPVSMRREEFESNLRSGHIREQSERWDYSNDYRLLDRLRTDCDYYLGAGGRSEKHLWAGSVEKQIAKMRELYAALPEKPERFLGGGERAR